MADSLVNGHERPRLDGSASCPSYYSLGMRRKEAGLAARLPVQIYCNRLDISEKAVLRCLSLCSEAVEADYASNSVH